MNLDTDRILLRDFTMDDLQDLHEIFSRDQMMGYGVIYIGMLFLRRITAT